MNGLMNKVNIKVKEHLKDLTLPEHTATGEFKILQAPNDGIMVIKEFEKIRIVVSTANNLYVDGRDKGVHLVVKVNRNNGKGATHFNIIKDESQEVEKILDELLYSARREIATREELKIISDHARLQVEPNRFLGR